MRDVILKALQDATGEKDISLEFPENEAFGDYSSNVALVSGKKAEEIVGNLRGDKTLAGLVSKIEVAGPGFINFFLSKEALILELQKINQEHEGYGKGKEGKGKIVVIDYSSPNIAKRFGIGHMRSTIIGQALYNLYSFLGYKIVGDNHLGDWGTQFGVLLAQISKAKSSLRAGPVAKLEAQSLNVDNLEELYVEFNIKAEKDPKLWDEARGWFKKLEDGNPEARKVWKQVVDISIREFERIYKLLGVKIDYAYGESFYEDKMPAVIKILREKGLTKKSEGAEIVELSNLTPAILVKSDGASTYYTRDLATLKFRIDEWNPDLVIYEVGSEQTLHFRQLFESAKLLSWAKGRELVHIGHGLIRLPAQAGFKSGKMSTRRGQTIKLEDVLNEAIERAKKIIETSETSRGLSNKEKEDVAKAVGIGAVKYFDLMHHPTSDIIFDWEKMFVLEGNSAPYLQYTFARTQSVLRKAQSQKLKAKSPRLKDFKPSAISLELNDEEVLLLRSFVHFPEVIEDAALNYSPNLLCNYLFDLAQKYNTFYNSHRILDVKSGRVKEQESVSNFRVALTAATGQILEKGLKLLGIQTPERM